MATIFDLYVWSLTSEYKQVASPLVSFVIETFLWGKGEVKDRLCIDMSNKKKIKLLCDFHWQGSSSGETIIKRTPDRRQHYDEDIYCLKYESEKGQIYMQSIK